MKLLSDILAIELIKMRRSLGLWLTLIAPLVIVGMEFVVMWVQGELTEDFANGKIWLWHTKLTLTYWGLLALPLFITLETALLAGWEHKNHTWKLIFSQPVPRCMIITAKQFSGLVRIGISHTFLWVATIGTGIILRGLRPDLGFINRPTWVEMLAYSLITYLISWFILAVHSLVSLHWNNFVVAMAVGVIGTMSGVFFVSSDYAPFYPWAMAGLTANNLMESCWPWNQVALGMGGGILLFILSNLYLTRQEVL